MQLGNQLHIAAATDPLALTLGSLGADGLGSACSGQNSSKASLGTGLVFCFVASQAVSSTNAVRKSRMILVTLVDDASQIHSSADLSWQNGFGLCARVLRPTQYIDDVRRFHKPSCSARLPNGSAALTRDQRPRADDLYRDAFNSPPSLRRTISET